MRICRGYTTLLDLVSKTSRLIEQVLIRKEICKAVRRMTDMLTEMNLLYLWDQLTPPGYTLQYSGHQLIRHDKISGNCPLFHKLVRKVLVQ